MLEWLGEPVAQALFENSIAAKHAHHSTSLDWLSEGNRELQISFHDRKYIKDTTKDQPNQRSPEHIRAMYTSGCVVFQECRKLEETGEMNEQKKKKGEGGVCLSLSCHEVSLLGDCCAVHRVRTGPRHLHTLLRSSGRIEPPNRNHFLVSQGGLVHTWESFSPIWIQMEVSAGGIFRSLRT